MFRVVQGRTQRLPNVLVRGWCRAGGAVEGLGHLSMDDTAPHVHVLRHGNVAVPELVGADARRHTLGVDDPAQEDTRERSDPDDE